MQQGGDAPGGDATQTPAQGPAITPTEQATTPTAEATTPTAAQGAAQGPATTPTAAQGPATTPTTAAAASTVALVFTTTFANLDFADMSGATKEAFEAAYIPAVATAAGVAEAQVTVIRYTATTAPANRAQRLDTVDRELHVSGMEMLVRDGGVLETAAARAQHDLSYPVHATCFCGHSTTVGDALLTRPACPTPARYEAGSVVVHSEISVTDEAAGEAAAASLTGGAGVATLQSELGEAYGAPQVGDAEVVVSSAGDAPTPGPAPGEAPAAAGPAPDEAPATGPATGPEGPEGPEEDDRIKTCSVGFAGCTEMRLAYGKAFCGMLFEDMCQGCVLSPHQPTQQHSIARDCPSPMT